MLRGIIVGAHGVIFRGLILHMQSLVSYSNCLAFIALPEKMYGIINFDKDQYVGF